MRRHASPEVKGQPSHELLQESAVPDWPSQKSIASAGLDAPHQVPIGPERMLDHYGLSWV